VKTGAATVDHRCVKTEDHAVAASHSVDAARWQETFEVLMFRIAGRFARVEPRRRVRDLVLGLLSDLPRKNCWSISEWAGQASPHGTQHPLVRAKWDADTVRDDVREYVLEQLHDDDAVLVVDETGDIEEGHAHRGCPAPVHRHGREDRKRSGRCLPRLCRPPPEKAADVQLIERTSPRPLAATPAGAALIHEAEHLLSLLDSVPSSVT
jgi:hypothetical protein